MSRESNHSPSLIIASARYRLKLLSSLLEDIVEAPFQKLGSPRKTGSPLPTKFGVKVLKR